MERHWRLLWVSLAATLALAACSSAESPQTEGTDAQQEGQALAGPPAETPASSPIPEKAPDPDSIPDYTIVTLLPKDAIPAVDNPQFLTAEEADDEYAPKELVLGVEFNGEARAYSTSYLSSHEIVNDMVGGRKIAVTW